MSDQWAERVELTVDTSAVSLLAAAAAFSLAKLGAGLVVAGVAAPLAFLGGFRLLRSIPRRRASFSISAFDPEPVLPVELAELLLTNNERLDVDGPAGAEELVLDEVVTHFGEDSRVVRLFNRSAMPSPGELNARIDQHLVGSSQAAPPDASQALYDALTELRRSLR